MKATVRSIDGQLVLDDPDALAMIRAVGKHNCQNTLKHNNERVMHFVGRLAARGLDPKEWIIVILNVDDPHGGPIAEILMPGHDWQAYRDRSEIPFARGIANKDGIADALSFFDAEAATKLRKATTAQVVVVDHGVAEIFDAA